jgi:biotin-(acetyl-CoA carboxylase) ligase
MSCSYAFGNIAALLCAQYAVTLGVIRGVERELPQLRNVLRIKWPNDIYVLRPEPVKIGGVLVQSSSSHRSSDVHMSYPAPVRLVAGVGLNVTNSHPTLCLADLCAPPTPINIGALCGAVFQEVVAALRALDFGGLPAIQQVFFRRCLITSKTCITTFALQEFERRWLHSNQSVQVVMPGSCVGSQSGQQCSAVIKGLSTSGTRHSERTSASM